MIHLKKPQGSAEEDDRRIRETVEAMLADIESRGEAAVRTYAEKFDGWTGDFLLGEEKKARLIDEVPQQVKDDIRFAHDNVRRFAEAQMATLSDIEVEVVPGLIAGQKSIPVRAAGCYVPGGRYSHIASAIMTVTTAKVAGCDHISVCSPPRPETGVHPAIVYTADLCGADSILALGGVQGVASMAFFRRFFTTRASCSRSARTSSGAKRASSCTLAASSRESETSCCTTSSKLTSANVGAGSRANALNSSASRLRDCTSSNTASVDSSNIESKRGCF